MRRTLRLAAVLALVLPGCPEPPRKNRALYFAGGLQDINHWDPGTGARGNDSFDALLSLDPSDSVPVLLQTLLDPTPTKIDDGLHRIPTVGDVSFQILLLLFGMTPEQFSDEGVWVGSDPSRNPIYTVHLDDDAVRRRVRARFLELARLRKWIEPENE